MTAAAWHLAEHRLCAEVAGRLLAEAYRNGRADGVTAERRRRAEEVERELLWLREAGAALVRTPTLVERVSRAYPDDTPVQIAVRERAQAQAARVWAGWPGAAVAS